MPSRFAPDLLSGRWFRTVVRHRALTLSLPNGLRSRKIVVLRLSERDEYSFLIIRSLRGLLVRACLGGRGDVDYS